MTVIGPINHPDWYEMRQLHSSIQWMKQTDVVFYQEGIEHEQTLYEVLRSKYVGT